MFRDDCLQFVQFLEKASGKSKAISYKDVFAPTSVATSPIDAGNIRREIDPPLKGKNPSANISLGRSHNGRQSPLSGEPYALKGARTVRRGETGKQLDCASPPT